MDSATRFLVMLLVATFVLGVVGCTGADVASGPDDGSEQNEDTEGSCEIDDDCQSYYRCRQGACVTPPAMTGQPQASTPVATFYDGDDQVVARFYLELALSEAEQARGLMHRPEMHDDWGMLFVYDSDRQLSFWMKNTLIPLDMIFIDSAGQVVGVVAEAEPGDLSSHSVGSPARYVLEVNGGLAAQKGIEQGTTMTLDKVEQEHQIRP